MFFFVILVAHIRLNIRDLYTKSSVHCNVISLYFILNLALCFGSFLGVGQVVMDIIKNLPELDIVVQSVLRTGLQSMKSATLALDTVEGKTTKHPAHIEVSVN